MTDREMLEFAAKAIGVKGSWHRKGFVVYSGWPRGVFDPINDDGDALRLALKLHIAISHYGDATSHRGADGIQSCFTGPVNCYFDFDATRLAITRAAAEIGKRMP